MFVTQNENKILPHPKDLSEYIIKRACVSSMDTDAALPEYWTLVYFIKYVSSSEYQENKGRGSPAQVLLVNAYR
jgi:hypothetical protein